MNYTYTFSRNGVIVTINTELLTLIILIFSYPALVITDAMILFYLFAVALIIGNLAVILNTSYFAYEYEWLYAEKNELDEYKEYIYNKYPMYEKNWNMYNKEIKGYLFDHSAIKMI